MQDLIVCVGESCHLNGAEIVVTRFQEILSREKLTDRIRLKGSFCIGECCDDGRVSVRWRDRVLTVDPKQAGEAFARDILPGLGGSDERGED